MTQFDFVDHRIYMLLVWVALARYQHENSDWMFSLIQQGQKMRVLPHEYIAAGTGNVLYEFF